MVSDKFLYVMLHSMSSFAANVAKKKLRFLRWLKLCLIETFTHIYEIEIVEQNPDAEIQFVITILRDDYLKLFGRFYDSCTLRKSFMKVASAKKFNITVFLTMMKNIFVRHVKFDFSLLKTKYPMYEIEATTDYKPGFMAKWCCHALYARMCAFSPEISGVKYLATLDDAWCHEDFILGRAREKGIKTICFQHGLFIDVIGRRKTLGNREDLLYHKENYYVLWGEKTKLLFEKYNSGLNIKVCGNPLIQSADLTKQSDEWCVILDIPGQHDYNQKIIDIVSQAAQIMGKKVVLRIHPQESGRENSYSVDDSVCTFGRPELPAVCFGHTSTMLYTFLAQGIMALKFRSVVPSNDYCEELMFSTPDEIISILGNAPGLNLRKLSEPFINCIGDESFKKYQEFFSTL